MQFLSFTEIERIYIAVMFYRPSGFRKIIVSNRHRVTTSYTDSQYSWRFLEWARSPFSKSLPTHHRR